MTYRIKRVQLKNFVSHKDTDLSLGDGLTVLVGPNGAGKSSIVDAIYYNLVLPTQSLRGSRMEDMIRRSPNEPVARATVGLELEDSLHNKLIIERIIPRKGSSSVKILHRGQTTKTATKHSEARKLIAEILEVPPDTLEKVIKYAVVVRQEEFTEILNVFTAPSTKRKELLYKLFGIHEYKKALDKMNELAKIESQYHGIVTPTKTTKTHLEKKLTEYKKRLNEQKKKLDQIKQEGKKIIEEHQETLRNLREVQDKIQNLKQTLEDLSEIPGKYTQLTKARKRLESQYNQYQVLYNRYNCRDLLSQYTGLEETLEKLRPIIDKIREYQLKIKEQQTLLNDLETRHRDLETLYKILGELSIDEYSQLIREASNELEAIRREKERLQQTISSLQPLLDQIQARAVSLAKIIGEEDFESVNQLYRKASAILEQLTQEVENIQQEISSLEAQIEYATLQISDHEEKLEILTRNNQTTCPLCGSPLTREKHAHIVKDLEQKIHQYKQTIKNAESRIKQLKNELARKQAQHSKLQKALNSLESIYNLLLERYGKEPEELQVQVEEYKSKIKQLHKEENEKLEELKSLNKNYGLAESITKKYNIKKVTRKQLDQLRKELGDAKNKLLEYQKALNGLINEANSILGKEYREPNGLIKEHMRLEEKYKTYKTRAKKCEEYSNELARINQEIQEKNMEIQNLKPMLEKYNQTKTSLENLEKQANGLQEKVSRQREKLAGIKAEETTIINTLKELEDKIKEAEDLLKKLDILFYIKEVYKKAPEMIYRRKLRALREEITRVFSGFGLDYVDVEIIDTPQGVEFLLRNRDGIASTPEMLSGGEKTAFALALILALNRVLTGNIGFLILDEPTRNLDEERRKMLVEILRNIKSELGIVKQLVIVTHDDDLRDAADEVCTVSKDKGYSIVKCGDGGLGI
ncbi:MAG: SMC family ATPase [Desulfurococcales archaeon]|nr:SMC family ATPase [Desulfurococcales archaeon]